MVIYWGGLLLVLSMLLVAVFALSSGQTFVNQSKNHIAAISAGWDAESSMPAEPTELPSRNLDHAPPALFVGRDTTPVAPWAEPPVEQTNQPTESTEAAETEPDGNCPATSTQVEFMICDSSELTTLDRALIAAEADAVAAASPDEAGKIRSDASNWRAAARDLCDSADCLRLAYTTRLDEMAKVPIRATVVMTACGNDASVDLQRNCDQSRGLEILIAGRSRLSRP